ncbi:MAG: hypothetical protein K1X94_32215, partial [Sandaracinaceae bacterium]|nr:hypothetical protein [Sandaracinaceae bacterium]
MARVLYTSARGWFGEDAGFVDAATLSEALATVRALGHRRIRFWSSPALADPLDASPQAALAAAARPPWWKPLALGLALCLLLPLVWASYLEMLGLPIHAGVLGTTALTVALFLLAPTFGQLRTQI